MSDYRFITYEELDDATIVKVTLNRPEVRNAQNRGMLVELDQALMRAEADDRVLVVILAGSGKSFSAGHDMGTDVTRAETLPGPDQHPSFQANGGTLAGAEKVLHQEWHHYFENTRRWRDLRKTLIAQVQGPVVAAGAMVMWVADLIVAADDTYFCDVAGVSLGMCGVEYFAHPWEFGARRTKELLLTGDALGVDEAYEIGMVSKVFARDELETRTLEFARRVATVPSMAALLIKESVNQTQEAQGFDNAIKHSFHLHVLNHAHWGVLNDDRYMAMPAAQRPPTGLRLRSKSAP